ncbi:MAG: hypothetical protein ABIZ69_05065 [Ilumatobacteraceae bacterium]
MTVIFTWTGPHLLMSVALVYVPSASAGELLATAPRAGIVAVLIALPDAEPAGFS